MEGYGYCRCGELQQIVNGGIASHIWWISTMTGPNGTSHKNGWCDGRPADAIGSPQLPREPVSEDYAFMLAAVRDAVGEDVDE